MVVSGLCFCWPTPKSGAQKRGQGARKNTAGAEPRIALVIGNGSYTEGQLANPVNDARDMAAALRQLGFEVSIGENCNRRRMEDLIREFGRKIRGGGVGMFYFAGHGVQVGGANYLIPIGAVINGEAEVKYEAMDAGFVLAQMEEAQNRLNIVVLDACRNNPFARSFRSSSGGLASIDAPVGTLIAYATAPGRTASDGGGRNGLYTKELLAAMRVPGLKIEDVFKQVRSEVRRQSNNQQIPWEASSIEGDFYFSAPGVRPAPTAPTPAPTTMSSPAPALAEILQQAGDSLRHLDIEGVISAAQKALIADPNSGVAHRFLQEAYIYQHDSDRSNQARENALRLLEAPKNAMEYEARGVLYYLTDRRRAIADYNEAIRLDPNYALAYNNRGQAYLLSEDFDRAFADLGEAIRLDPKYLEAYINRGATYARKNEYDRAIADFSEAIRLDPKYAEAYNYRGATYNGKGEYDRAIADLSEAIRLDPKEVGAYINRGHAYNEKNEYDRAVADLSEAIRLDPKQASAYNNRGAAYIGKDEYDRAIADLSEAIRLDPKGIEAYINRGHSYITKGEYDRAIADLSEAIRLDPKRADAYEVRMGAYASMKDYDRAIADGGEVIRLDPNNARVYKNRASIYFFRQDYDRAIAGYSEAIRLDPKYAEAYKDRASAYRKIGRKDLAEADEKRAKGLSGK
jgi:tetratricopeptide (TPR) repeat protein